MMNTLAKRREWNRSEKKVQTYPNDRNFDNDLVGKKEQPI